MKTIGLIGGITWHSTIDYYRIINEKVNKSLGNNASAKILLYSVNYDEIVPLTQQENWVGIEAIISEAAKKLENAGVDCILLCANTMHIIAEKVQSTVHIPVLHIAESVAIAIEQRKLKSILLLGTKYTMQSSFYSGYLRKYGINILVPDLVDMEAINNSIYDELGKGVLLAETKKMYLDIIEKYIDLGAQGVILGCTEIPMLIEQVDCTIPIFNTTLLHASAAACFALS